MKILVTGSTGFVGKYACEELKKKKHTIIPFARSIGNNIVNAQELENAAKKADILVHLAAEIDETKNAEEIYRTNVEGTVNALNAAIKNKCKQFIFLSSVGVYGKNSAEVDENSGVNPITSYEKSKLEAEKRVIQMQGKIPFTIIRSALVLGPNKYWKDIFKIIRKGFPLVGKGENSWQMIYVKDLAAFVEKCVGNKKAYNEIFVAAENERHSLRQIVDMIAEIQGKKRVGSIPKQLGKGLSYLFLLHGKITGKKSLLIPAHVERLFKHRAYKIEKAVKLGWKPKYTTRAALEETYSALQKEFPQ